MKRNALLTLCALVLFAFCSTAFGQTLIITVVNDTAGKIAGDTATAYVHSNSSGPVKYVCYYGGSLKNSIVYTDTTGKLSGPQNLAFKMKNLGDHVPCFFTTCAIDSTGKKIKCANDSAKFVSGFHFKAPELKQLKFDSLNYKWCNLEAVYDVGGWPTDIKITQTSPSGGLDTTISGVVGRGSIKLKLIIKNPNTKHIFQACAKNQQEFEDCRSGQFTTPAFKAPKLTLTNPFIGSDSASCKIASDLGGADSAKVILEFRDSLGNKLSIDTFTISDTQTVTGKGKLMAKTKYSWKCFISTNYGSDSVLNNFSTLPTPPLPSGTLVRLPSPNKTTAVFKAKINGNGNLTYAQLEWGDKWIPGFSDSSGFVNVGGQMYEKEYTVYGLDSTLTYRFVLTVKNIGGKSRDTLECKTSDPIATTGMSMTDMKGVLVFPNPASDFVSIVLPNNEDKGKMTFYDISGKIVKELLVSQSQKIPIDDLSKGLYLYSVVLPDGTIHGKLIVQ